MEFRRNLIADLLAWNESSVRKPLVLQGARQVGKTWLLRHLGRRAFKDTAYFNFEEQPDLKQLFEQTREVDRLLQTLSLVHGRAIHPRTTLIIFDEIQECNPALTSLKYFYENAAEYAVAAAGSLLGISLGRERTFPVGKVTFLQVHPLSFSEFLSAADPPLSGYLDQLERIEPIPDIFFHPLLEKLNLYFISGGMPEAASTILVTLSREDTESVLQDILRAYQLDFSKHAPAIDIPRIGYIWNSIPAQLGRENKKFLYKVVRPGARAREYENALLWLEQAGLIHKINRSAKPHLPLSAYDDVSAFKLYTVDVGLLRSLARLDPSVVLHGNRLFTEFKGSLAENFVLQHLLPQFGISPRYWTSDGKAEVDFLIQYKNQIIPCEVKADENIRSKSLAVYNEKFRPPIRIRFSLRNLTLDNGLLNVPLILAGKTETLLGRII